MFYLLNKYKPILHYCVVRWNPPQQGWIRINTDGASKGNPGLTSYGFCLRNHKGDLIYAEGQRCDIMTNLEAEVLAI